MKNLETLIQKLCPDGVEFVKLGEVCEIKTGKGITQKDCSESSKYPVYSGGKEPMGYYKEFNRNANTVTVSRVGAYAGFVNYVTEDFYLNDKCFSVLPQKDEDINSKYLYYKLKALECCIINMQSGGGVPTINTKKVGSLEIPLPPIEVQTEIVRILDKFTSREAELEMELEAELDCRKRQYEYYRDKLLSFDNVGRQEVEWKKMSEVCLKTSKINWKLVEGEYKYIDLSSVDRDNHKISDCTIINKENAPSRAQQVVKTGDILFGTTRPTLMRFCYIPKEYDGEVCSTGYCVIRVNNEMINSHFAYHFLFTQKFQEYVEGHQKGASYPAISNKDVMSFELPIPSLQEQERIANILDRFESLTTSLQSGLPAEISARRKQYEYYRGKLLTFKRKGAA